MVPAAGPVLGVDTATSRTGIALVDDTVVLAEAAFHRRVPPSRSLMPALEVILSAAGLEPAGLAALAVTVGPGGFTGIRVGLATMRALAEAAGRPLAGVSTLAAVAAAVSSDDRPVAVWLDAGRHEVYAGLFHGGDAAGPESVASPADVLADLPHGPILFAGDGALCHAALIAGRAGAAPADTVSGMPAGVAAATARLGRQALAAGTALPPAPRYLRPPDATLARG
ncbi:MAG: tRNA (adenosine(37)-N6)-threonylcarbamoyltransferase complex dimerization subunit type 1 TsaB [Acidobacteria bacterium]|nr:MAG: tRNA (adenosine(37)-N6)-threonylcarbamoyltransferase complex dimerization subunit type 1 TsaB [Acidobacteriota bacterium]TDI45650.1 MAG: tRNA (adenosine(37)-N6)-threonylcarbamoyltransferase complex dimerization subunit type 1 TsaB [Acidobacteriota bacterium]